MIELPVLDNSGKKVDALSIDEAQLGGEVRPALLKQAYVMFHANRRQGSARTKSRGMVEGSTRKLYRQKGTGNARAGTVRTPIRKGGGVTFAKDADTGKWRQRMPRKMRRLANRNALLAKLVDGEVKCIDSLDLDTPRTKDMKKVLEACGVDRTCLIALATDQRGAALSARNIDNVRTIRIDQLNAFELLNHRYLVVDKATLESFLDGSAFSTDGKDVA
ncbi:MAG: 50S ribosomal protein L4 [Phycisphaerales bacterium]|nr:50S ribosomal protein L4 [Phycisphaerales bacterium]